MWLVIFKDIYKMENMYWLFYWFKTIKIYKVDQVEVTRVDIKW